mmetsp:Transcript_28339/g.39287  ORF Transcript_28339/g.39287 Transcript_28339/m.39287 type:complete len:126 (+) Transcript_28339:84-461(+)
MWIQLVFTTLFLTFLLEVQGYNNQLQQYSSAQNACSQLAGTYFVEISVCSVATAGLYLSPDCETTWYTDLASCTEHGTSSLSLLTSYEMNVYGDVNCVFSQRLSCLDKTNQCVHTPYYIQYSNVC